MLGSAAGATAQVQLGACDVLEKALGQKREVVGSGHRCATLLCKYRQTVNCLLPLDLVFLLVKREYIEVAFYTNSTTGTRA